jgi:hypothetical protein
MILKKSKKFTRKNGNKSRISKKIKMYKNKSLNKTMKGGSGPYAAYSYGGVTPLRQNLGFNEALKTARLRQSPLPPDYPGATGIGAAGEIYRQQGVENPNVQGQIAKELKNRQVVEQQVKAYQLAIAAQRKKSDEAKSRRFNALAMNPSSRPIERRVFNPVTQPRHLRPLLRLGSGPNLRPRRGVPTRNPGFPVPGSSYRDKSLNRMKYRSP